MSKIQWALTICGGSYLFVAIVAFAILMFFRDVSHDHGSSVLDLIVIGLAWPRVLYLMVFGS